MRATGIRRSVGSALSHWIADLVHGTGAEMFDAVKMLRSAIHRNTCAERREYPRSQFGSRLLQIAQLVKANVGLEIAFADAAAGIRT